MDLCAEPQPPLATGIPAHRSSLRTGTTWHEARSVPGLVDGHADNCKLANSRFVCRCVREHGGNGRQGANTFEGDIDSTDIESNDSRSEE